MRILLFHPAVLPPKNYGGTERVLLWLARGLRELGHSVSIGCFPESRLEPGIDPYRVDRQESSARHLAQRVGDRFDVIHFMAPPEPGTWEILPCPAILTVHGNGKPGERFPRNSVFISANHAERHHGNRFIYHGLDPAEFQVGARDQRKNYLFFSKTSWRVKNLKGAVAVCKKAGKPLSIAGGHRPLGLRVQALFRPGWDWIGPVAGAEKSAMLAQARALLFPVLWEEPFGLVLIEALFSGTPVFAAPRGSVPEIIRPEAGLLLATENDWVQALREEREKAFHPEALRAYAESRFHYRRMAEDYVKVYQEVSQGKVLHQEEPWVQKRESHDRTI